MRTRTLPMWLAWIGFVVTLLSFPMVPPVSFIADLVLAVWAIAFSVLIVTEASPNCVVG